MEKGTLYVVATPIGNLKDITLRALEVLREVDLIAAEDTRHSGKLLQHYGIKTPTLPYHEHNERRMTPRLVERLRQGERIALISDAGTPLIHDPGHHLVRAAFEAGLPVTPIPGPSALTAALSVCPLGGERFAFEGFLPPRREARARRLAALRDETRLMVFFEAPHRILETLAAMAEVFGRRRAFIARELTKRFETLREGELLALLDWLSENPEQQKGEFVLVVEGNPSPDTEGERLLRILLEELPMKQAVALASKLSGAPKNALYTRALEIAKGG